LLPKANEPLAFNISPAIPRPYLPPGGATIPAAVVMRNYEDALRLHECTAWTELNEEEGRKERGEGGGGRHYVYVL